MFIHFTFSALIKLLTDISYGCLFTSSYSPTYISILLVFNLFTITFRRELLMLINSKGGKFLRKYLKDKGEFVLLRGFSEKFIEVMKMVEQAPRYSLSKWLFSNKFKTLQTIFDWVTRQ